MLELENFAGQGNQETVVDKCMGSLHLYGPIGLATEPGLAVMSS